MCTQSSPARPASILDGVSAEVPPLSRAVALARAAALEGFDWSCPEEVVPVVRSEVDELIEAVDLDDPSRIEQEFGDLLLALSNLARHLHLDPAVALDGACDRFEARFRRVEDAVRCSGRTMHEHSLEELDALWARAKADLAAAAGATCSRS